MNLISQIFFAVLISSVTSSVLFLAWRLLRGLFMWINPKMIYATLRWICVMYILPVGYIAVLVTYRVWFQGKSEIWKMVFMHTEKTAYGLRIASVIWFLAVCSLIMYRYIDHKVWSRKLRDNIPEEEPVVVDTFRRVCRKLCIPEDELELNRNVLLSMPLVIGLKHPQVLLTERDYTVQDLEMIFYHELSHHKHKDLRFKGLVVIIMMIHCFNPVVYVLLRTVNLWSECMADVSALEASDSLHHIKPYFDNILSLVPDNNKAGKEKFFFSTLCKNQKTLSRRVDFMKKYLSVKPKGKVLTTVLTAAFIFASTTTAFASGSSVADLHRMIYQHTEEQMDESSDADKIGTSVVTEDGMVEYYCRVEDLDAEGMEIVSTPEQDIVTLAENVHYTFDWIVNPNTRHVSAEYKIKSGRVIATSVTVSPTNKDFKLGIMTDDGVARFVRGRGAASHVFNITETNNYRVFVQSDYTDGTKLHATGSFEYEVK